MGVIHYRLTHMQADMHIAADAVKDTHDYMGSDIQTN